MSLLPSRLAPLGKCFRHVSLGSSHERTIRVIDVFSSDACSAQTVVYAETEAFAIVGA